MKKILTLFAVAMMALASQANVLTICEGDGETTGTTAPLYGFYYDTDNTLCQFIYPADMLTDMVGGKISELRFFSRDAFQLRGGEVQLSFKIVDQDRFTEPAVVAETEAVATGSPVDGETELVFTLDEPYEYNGGNLLVETLVTTHGGFKTTYFYGVHPGYNANLFRYKWANWADPTVDLEDFLPKAEFTYEPGTEPGPEPGLTYEGYWLILIDKDGNEIPFQLSEGANADYSTTVALNYHIYGMFDGYHGEERPQVPFYFIVNDVKYGANENETPAILGTAMSNPLNENENYYTVPVGYNYTLGIAIDQATGRMYVYAAQAGFTGIDEISSKAVTSVRYYNLAGQEMKEANGLTIVVTTYTDGTTNAVKVVK